MPAENESDPRSTRVRAALLVLALVPLAYLVAVLARWTVDVPLWDSWFFAPAVDHMFSGTLSWEDVVGLHNEHRPVFSRLVLLLLARLSRWQTSWETAANVVCGSAIFLVFLRGATRALEGTGPAPAVLAPALSLLAFSLVQWENWICGWQLQLFLNVLAVAGGLLLLARPGLSAGRLAAGIALGVVATFTLASGFAYWVLGGALVVLGTRSEPARRRRFLAAWGTALAACAVLYAIGYHEAAEKPNLLYSLQHPLAFVEFVLRFVGAPVVSRDRRLAIAAGALGLAIPVIAGVRLARRGRDARAFAGLAAVGLYALGNAVLVSIGRASFGGKNAMQSRYTTLAMPLWVLDVTLLLLAIRVTGSAETGCAGTSGDAGWRRARRFLPHVALALVLVGAGESSVRETFDLREKYETVFLPSRAAVLGPDFVAIKKLFYGFDADMTVEKIAAMQGPRYAVLKKHGLGPFRGK